MGFFPSRFEPHFGDGGESRPHLLLPPSWTQSKALNLLRVLLPETSVGCSERCPSDHNAAGITSDRRGEHPTTCSIKSLSCLISLSRCCSPPPLAAFSYQCQGWLCECIREEPGREGSSPGRCPSPRGCTASGRSHRVAAGCAHTAGERRKGQRRQREQTEE